MSDYRTAGYNAPGERIADLEQRLAAAEAERLTDALVVEQLQREIAAAEAARGIAEQQLTVICDGVNRRCGCDNNQLPLVSLDRLLAAHERDLAEAEARINRREFSVRLQSQRLYGQGFAAYLNGSATEGSTVIIADLHAILESCVDSGEAWKRVSAESCVHELLHAFQEILGREFNDDEVEAAIAAARAAGGREGVSDELRTRLGRRVREAWIRWAERQPNPKPSWLVPYDELPPEDQDADECIGIAIWAECVDSLQSELGELEAVRAELNTANTTIRTLQAGVARRVYGVLYDEVRPSELILVTVDKLVQRLAAIEQTHASDRISLVAFMLREPDIACMTGECRHEMQSDCIQEIIDAYEAAKAGGRE